MPKKKSIKRTAQEFIDGIEDVRKFVTETTPATPNEYHGWLYDHVLVRLYRDFEYLILNSLVGAINHDTSTISHRAGFKFPRHLSDEFCQYLIVGDGYFDIKGRDGLIKQLKRFVPDAHYLLVILKQDKYKKTIAQLCALRNYTAHGSPVSKARAKEATGSARLRCAGLWLQSGNRFSHMTSRLIELATEIRENAPY